MATTTFDTLGYAKKLEQLGFTREQSEGFAQLQREIIDERVVTREHFDTRMKEMDGKIREMEYRLTIRLGAMMAACVAAVAALVKLL